MVGKKILSGGIGPTEIKLSNKVVFKIFILL